MAQLTKGMYADYQTDLFGIRYNQMKTDAVIHNAGWFNDKGEKLGFGDLSFDDLDNISSEVDFGEIFFALTESDTTWDMPTDLDSNSPGIAYVMAHAKWAVSGLANHTEGNIYLVKPDHYFHPSKDCMTQFNDKGIETHYVVTSGYLAQSLGFDGKVFVATKAKNSVDEFLPNGYYGLDVYHMDNGESWLVGDQIKFDRAVREAAQTLVWSQSYEVFSTYVTDDDELVCINKLQAVVGYVANSSICKILGPTNLEKVLTHIIGFKGMGVLTSHQDKNFWYSSDVDGLPPGVYAMRYA